ncbi:MAG: outer membrane protein assembly factor BamD [Burkholderiaceae bacterium]
MRYFQVTTLTRAMRALLGMIIAMSMVACAGPEEVDETVGWSAQKLYTEAKDDMASGRYADAVKLLEKLVSRYPFGALAQQAQIDIAFAHYRDGERALGLAAVDRFLKLHPDHEVVDYMYYLRGLINFSTHNSLLARIGGQDLSERDLQATRAAYDSFETVVRRFPSSRYAPDSILRMRYLLNAMAAGEIAVARFYFSRGAYLAAANRAKDVVREYQQVPAVEEALYIQMRAYEELGLPELQAATKRVLEQNFPASKDHEAALNGEEKSWWKVWR